MKSALLTFPSLFSSRRRALLLAGVLALASVLTLGPTPITAITATLTIRPNSGGSFTEWALYPDGTNWESVDEGIQNGDVDYVYINASAKADSYNFQNVTQINSISNVRVCTYAKQTVGNEKLKHILVIDGAKYYGAINYTPATTYLLYTNDWANNPATNSSWTWSEINSLEAGIESVGVDGWEGEIRVTQVFIEVTVTDLKPPTVSVSYAPGTFTINITVTDVVDLYSWQVGMTFNATVVEVLSLVEGPFLRQGGTTIMTRGTIDNTNGIVHRHAFSLTGPVPGVTGNGTLATITFKLKNYGNSTLHLIDVILLDSTLTEIPYNTTDGYFEVEQPPLDVYTQKAGLGPMAPGSAFSPGESVTLRGYVCYEGIPVMAVNVGFQVNDPTESVILARVAATDVSGVATISFTLPLSPVFGTYKAIATARVFERDFSDNLGFDVGWIVEIVSVIPCDVYGNPKTGFVRGDMTYFRVIVKNIALEPQMALVTVNAFDVGNVSIGVASRKELIASGTSSYILNVEIPTWAEPGYPATVKANAYTDWPELGGVAYCPEVSATFEIS